ncbi:hypothetical protein FPV67DRAFT_1451767 [Lyophyllum atratum]|nr:hypothetical protein FPV67DRAFT_1451767 [Lyophyllum atratum]
MAAAFVPPPLELYNHPWGYYGISYDIGTNATEHDLPNGWNSRRGGTYRQLIALLNNAGYQRHQYSDYRSSSRKSAVRTWLDMWDLRNIEPPMKFESTVKGCKMQYYRRLDLYDITRHIQLGGLGARALRGITPAGLVNTAQQRGAQLNPLPQPVFALPGGRLPRGTRNSGNAQVLANWYR